MASANRPRPRPTLSAVAEATTGDSANPVKTIEAALDRLTPPGRIGAAGSLAVAVSGGSDSMALLSIAAGWARDRGRDLHAVTVDHGLRSESAAEAAFVADHAARIGVGHHILQVGEMAPGNLSAAAREARYSLMASWAVEQKVMAVALGHSMDDQAETLLMRLARGSGVDGLASMRPRRDWQGVAWIRPMLAIRRQDLRTWLRAEGIPWIDDPSNEDLGFDRVKARRALSLLEPVGITVEGLARTAEILALQRLVLARAASELELQAVRHGKLGEAYLVRAAFSDAEYDTGLRVFADTLASIAGRNQRLRARVLEPAFARLFGRFPEVDGGAEAQASEVQAGEVRAGEAHMSSADRSAGAAADEAAMDRAAEGPSPMTIGGCLAVPGAEDGSILICREPGAVEGPTPVKAETLIWDRRWLITAPAMPEGGWVVGALGPAGCSHLRRASANGEWNPPGIWASAARPVRETVAAIFSAGDRSTPAAVPAIGYVAQNMPPELAGITTEALAAPAAAERKAGRQ